MKSFLAFLAVILLSVSILTVGAAIYVSMVDYISYQKVALERQEKVDKNNAIDECLKVSSVTTNEANSQRTEPSLFIYKLCIEDKGYSTSYKN